MINDLYHIQKMERPKHKVCGAGYVNPSIILLGTSRVTEITLPLHFDQINIRIYVGNDIIAYAKIPTLLDSTELRNYIYHNALRIGLRISITSVEEYLISSMYEYIVKLEGFVEEQEHKCCGCGCKVYLNLATNKVECLNYMCVP